MMGITCQGNVNIHSTRLKSRNAPSYVIEKARAISGISWGQPPFLFFFSHNIANQAMALLQRETMPVPATLSEYYLFALRWRRNFTPLHHGYHLPKLNYGHHLQRMAPESNRYLIRGSIRRSICGSIMRLYHLPSVVSKPYKSLHAICEGSNAQVRARSGSITLEP